MVRKLRIAISAVLLVGSLMAITAATASANGGPHEGTFTGTTDACAGCHRAHTGVAAKLLKTGPSQYTLCIVCHDGTGANTKVTTGIYLGSANGTTNAGLRGGGFEQALMNTPLSATFGETANPSSITSRHSVNGTSLTTWGSNTTGNGEAVSLVCGNCHNPHGNGNYRMLRPRPSSLASYDTILPAIGISGNASENYTVLYVSSNYTRNLNTYGGNVSSVIGDWCAQCHTRYLASTGAGSANSTQSPYLYRHMTNGLNGECFRCHVAHGTSANMTGWAGNSTLTWPDGAATQTWQTGTEGQYSRLLTVDNRGVCLQCHTSSALTGN